MIIRFRAWHWWIWEYREMKAKEYSKEEADKLAEYAKNMSDEDFKKALVEVMAGLASRMKLLPKEAVEDLYNNPEKYIGDSDNENT